MKILVVRVCSFPSLITVETQSIEASFEVKGDATEASKSLLELKNFCFENLFFFEFFFFFENFFFVFFFVFYFFF